MGLLKDGVYTLNCTVQAPCGRQPVEFKEGDSSTASSTQNCLVAGISADTWHCRFGHLGKQNMMKLTNSDLVKDMAVSTQTLSFCESCAQGKTHQQSYPNISDTRSADILDLIHTDVCGPIYQVSLGGKCYFVTFTDDGSRFVWVRFIRHKSEVFQKFCDLIKELEKGTGRKLKALRSDRVMFGEDYNQTFSPVVRWESVSTIISLAAQYDMEIHQMDVETAFLNGWLDKEIYMKQPEDFASLGQQNLVCKLKRFLYGLKQSPRCWNEVLHEQLVDKQFVQSAADQCLYIGKNCGSLVLGRSMSTTFS